jgi:hypothetical protein
MEPSQERVVQSASVVRGEDRKASETLDSFQKMVDLDVGVTVVAILDLTLLCEQPYLYRS